MKSVKKAIEEFVKKQKELEEADDKYTEVESEYEDYLSETEVLIDELVEETINKNKKNNKCKCCGRGDVDKMSWHEAHDAVEDRPDIKARRKKEEELEKAVSDVENRKYDLDDEVEDALRGIEEAFEEDELVKSAGLSISIWYC